MNTDVTISGIINYSKSFEPILAYKLLIALSSQMRLDKIHLYHLYAPEDLLLENVCVNK